MDNHSCVIVDVQATPARLSQESVAAREMITRFTERQGRAPQTLAADTSYGNGELLGWLEERGITPQIPVKESPFGNNGRHGVERFTYRPENNTYICRRQAAHLCGHQRTEPHARVCIDPETLP